MQKTFSLLAAFFAFVLLREKQKKPFVSTKEPFCFPNVLHTLFLENEEKTSEKNFFFLSIIL